MHFFTQIRIVQYIYGFIFANFKDNTAVINTTMYIFSTHIQHYGNTYIKTGTIQIDFSYIYFAQAARTFSIEQTYISILENYRYEKTNL